MWISGKKVVELIMFDSVKWVMKKMAVLINGVSSPIKDRNFLTDFLEELGYEVRPMNLVGEDVDFRNIEMDRSVDLIIGWSLGAMVAPYLALKNPKAKLILIAGGVNNVLRNKVLQNFAWLMYLGLRLPKNLLVFGYERVNPIVGEGVQTKYKRQMEENIKFFRSLSHEHIKKIMLFLADVHNGEVLCQLKNKTLIMSGKDDKLIPMAESIKIKSLIADSKLVVTGGGHYNVIGRNELPIVKEFLA